MLAGTSCTGEVGFAGPAPDFRATAWVGQAQDFCRLGHSSRSRAPKGRGLADSAASLCSLGLTGMATELQNIPKPKLVPKPGQVAQ